MASIVPRRNKGGEVLSYQVKWKDGGKRSDGWQCERFDDEGSAKVFRDAVDEAGQHWPPGWVKGKGYIDPTAADQLRYRFDRWAVESVENRTASKRYKQQRIRALEMYMFPTFGNCDIRSAEHFSKATIGAVRTAAQAFIAAAGLETVGVLDADWGQGLSFAGVRLSWRC
ncbi:holin [Streptomyces sp. NPDC056831]|uniref:holin n=1 Tax=Streptomyces sp. NPDC056831 TaxID=3345954 RepID=UPI0036960B7A